jgi:hypothetical protein
VREGVTSLPAVGTFEELRHRLINVLVHFLRILPEPKVLVALAFPNLVLGCGVVNINVEVPTLSFRWSWSSLTYRHSRPSHPNGHNPNRRRRCCRSSTASLTDRGLIGHNQIRGIAAALAESFEESCASIAWVIWCQ